MAELPLLRSESPGSLLTRWLRIAGFAVEAEPPGPVPLNPGGPRVTRVHLPAEPGWVLVPEGDWVAGFVEVVRALGVGFEDLHFLHRCAPCGDRLEYVARELVPAGVPALARKAHPFLLRCLGCARVSWPGGGHAARIQRLRDLYLEHLFRCARCGTEDGATRGRNLARVEVRCAVGPVVLSEAELARDQSGDILALLASIEAAGPEAADEVAFHRDRPLCDACRRRLVTLLRDFLREPAGATRKASPALSKVYVLLLFVPLAAAGIHLHWSAGTVFGLCALAIMPMAFLLGEATEHLAERSGPGVGGFVNATFGNATELIIGIFGLMKGGEALLVVKASVTGAILGNLLLIVGLAMFVGGWGRDSQKFNSTAVATNHSMMILAVAGLMLPSVMAMVERLGGGLSHGKHFTPALQQEFSYWVAAILAVSYVLSLLFAFVTHKHVFKGPEHGDDEPLDQVWSVSKALGVILFATLVIAFLSEGLIHSVEAAGKAMGLSPLFMGLVVVATVGNAAEHSSAVLVARNDKMDLALQIALGSASQIALFVGPVLVFVSWLLGAPMSLVFTPLEVMSVALAVAIAAQVSLDGESNWFEGFQLLALYGMIAVGFFYLT